MPDMYIDPSLSDQGGSAPTATPDYNADYNQPAATTESSDPINSNVSELMQAWTRFLAAEGGTLSDAALSSSERGQGLLSGAGSAIAGTGSSEKSLIGKAMDYIAKDIFNFNTDQANKDPTKNDFPKLAATGVGLALGGAGAAYAKSKELAQVKELTQQKLDIDRQLAASQQALNAAKTSQNLSSLAFKPPQVQPGLINAPARIIPLKNRVGA